MNVTLLPFHTQIANAWGTFIHRWGSAVIIQALMIVPGLLMVPLIVEYATAVEQGIDPTFVYQNSLYGGAFIWGFFLLLLLGLLTSTALMILFAAQEKISFMTALTSAVKRYIPVLYTSLVSAIAVIGALVPAYLLNYWYTVSARAGLPLDGSGIVALDSIILIAVVALLIPTAIVAVWVMYAPLLVALKAAPAGFAAIMHARHMVHKHIWHILWRMIGAVILFQIISVSLQSLYPISLIAPFILALVATAFFIEIYKELRDGT